jgi:hypothetical protein
MNDAVIRNVVITLRRAGSTTVEVGTIKKQPGYMLDISTTPKIPLHRSSMEEWRLGALFVNLKKDHKA